MSSTLVIVTVVLTVIMVALWIADFILKQRNKKLIKSQKDSIDKEKNIEERRKIIG